MWHLALALRVMLKSNDQSSSWWGSPLQKQAVLLKEPHGYHETAYHSIPSSLNTDHGANTLQKKNYSITKNFLHWKKIWPARAFFHHSFSRSSTCSTLPWRLLVSSEANSPLTIMCICKMYWTCLQISSDLPQVAVPVVIGVPCLFTLCVSQDLLCFSWCIFLWMRGVHGNK